MRLSGTRTFRRSDEHAGRRRWKAHEEHPSCRRRARRRSLRVERSRHGASRDRQRRRSAHWQGDLRTDPDCRRHDRRRCGAAHGDRPGSTSTPFACAPWSSGMSAIVTHSSTSTVESSSRPWSSLRETQPPLFPRQGKFPDRLGLAPRGKTLCLCRRRLRAALVPPSLGRGRGPSSLHPPFVARGSLVRGRPVSVARPRLGPEPVHERPCLGLVGGPASDCEEAGGQPHLGEGFDGDEPECSGACPGANTLRGLVEDGEGLPDVDKERPSAFVQDEVAGDR